MTNEYDDDRVVRIHLRGERFDFAADRVGPGGIAAQRNRRSR